MYVKLRCSWKNGTVCLITSICKSQITSTKSETPPVLIFVVVFPVKITDKDH